MNGKTFDAYPLAAAALVMPIFGLLAPLGLSPLLVIVALAVLAMWRGRLLALTDGLAPIAALFVLLSAWGALSATWSIIPGHSLFEAGRLLLLSAGGLVVMAAARGLDGDGRRLVGSAAVAGLVAGLIVMMIELLGHFPIRSLLDGGKVTQLPYYDRGATIISLFSWIAILHLLASGRRLAAAVLFILAAAVVSRMVSLSALLAMIIAVAIFALAWWRARVATWTMSIGMVLLAAILPFVSPDRDAVLWLRQVLPGLRGSATHRLVIWHFSSERWHDHPLLGWGMDASRAVPDGKTDVTEYMNLPAEWNLTGAVMPLHPHDAVLQWWLELGVVGAVLGTAIVLAALWRAAAATQPPRIGRAVALAVVATALPPLLLNFGVWQSWWESSLWLIAALVVALAAEPRRAA